MPADTRPSLKKIVQKLDEKAAVRANGDMAAVVHGIDSAIALFQGKIEKLQAARAALAE